MEPSKTHSATLPQHGLTHRAEGCHSELRSDDLMLGGHEGANPHVGRRVASEATDCAVAGPSHAPEETANTRGVHRDPDPPLTRLQAFNIFIEESKKINGRLGRPTDLSKPERVCLMSLTLAKHLNSPLSNAQEEKFAMAIGLFICKAEKKFKTCKSNYSHFVKKNKDWLNKSFIDDIPQDLVRSRVDVFPQNFTQSALHIEEEQHITPTVSANDLEEQHVDTSFTTTLSPYTEDSSKKRFEELNPRQKQRAIKRLKAKLEDEPPEKLTKTFTKTITVGDEKLSKKSARDLEIIINKCIETPDKPTKILTMINQETHPYTPEETLGIMIDRRLSVETYKFLQQDSKKRGFNLYPPYHQVAQARQSCYPSEEISVSEIEASVTLQGLLAHTLQRILDLNDESVNHYMEKENISQLACTFYVSWGFDGSTGQSVYRQEFREHSGDPDFDEKSIIATTLVPLKIQECGGKNSLIWLNPAPQSFRSCRPLHIQYRKETQERILSEKEYIEEQIRLLTPITTLTSKGFIVFTNCNLTLSLIDGKVFNIINNTSSQLRCAICKLTSTNFNNLDLAFSIPITEEAALKNGMSPLHAYIRCLEFLLHLGYKNDPRVRQWRVKKNSDLGQITAERKKEIQNQIKESMSLLVDVVKPNSGTSNDGNTARRVFKSEQSRQTFANILGIEKWLVDDLNVILIAINSGLPIDAKKFGTFCKNVAYKYVEKYNWHPMTTTIHKILIHGEKIIENSALPIGLLSEQAGESRNKFWRQDREHHSRKDSRVHTMMDLFHRALESSDPVISAIRLKQRLSNRRRMPLPEAVIEMLQPDNSECLNEDNSDVEEETACTESEENEFTTLLYNEDSLFNADDV